MLFFPACRYFFILKRALFHGFLLKTDILFYIIFSLLSSRLAISVTCLNNSSKLRAKQMKKYLHDKNIKYHIKNICHQFLYLQVIYIAEYVVVKHWIKFLNNHISLLFQFET